MKIPASVRRSYEDQEEPNNRLKQRVDPLIEGQKDKRWHYESRVKSLQSFALKLESGRVVEPRRMEDFFAAMLVVPNAAEVVRAETWARATFDVHERRPPDPRKTHKAPDAFPFDDLRLYIRLKQDEALPPSDLTAITFELQIKTFLQHAWGIATHDLIYKTDEVSWSKERIAYQTKAMLEHAEISIHQAEQLAGDPALSMQDGRSRLLGRVIEVLKREWSAEELPVDVKRLAQNVAQVINALRLRVEDLDAVLQAGKASRGGMHPANLSPYLAIVSYLLQQRQADMQRVLTDAESKLRVLVAGEVDLPQGMNRDGLVRAVFV